MEMEWPLTHRTSTSHTFFSASKIERERKKYKQEGSWEAYLNGILQVFLSSNDLGDAVPKQVGLK